MTWFLSITGRVKDQFKTDKAKFIAPAPIELRLSANADLDQVCVVGNGLPQPIALVTLSAVAKGKPPQLVENELQKTIEETNKTLEKHEHIQAAVILKDNWTIENGLLTPSMKIKRNGVEKLFQPKYADWVKVHKPVVWE